MPSPVLTCPTGASDTGAYRVSWTGPEGATYRLVENGQVLYEGTQLASTVTGREAGEYEYTVGAVEGERVDWSEPCHVSVDPPSLALAFALFGVGFVVFLATLAVVIVGHRAHRRGELG